MTTPPYYCVYVWWAVPGHRGSVERHGLGFYYYETRDDADHFAGSIRFPHHAEVHEELGPANAATRRVWIPSKDGKCERDT